MTIIEELQESTLKVERPLYLVHTPQSGLFLTRDEMRADPKTVDFMTLKRQQQNKSLHHSKSKNLLQLFT